jgi:hypothetical protein
MTTHSAQIFWLGDIVILVVLFSLMGIKFTAIDIMLLASLMTIVVLLSDISERLSKHGKI